MIDVNLIDEIDVFGEGNAHICSPEQSKTLIKNTPKSINIMHLNIRSVNCNFDNFIVFLASLQISCEIITLSECWLTESSMVPEIEGYVSYYTSRPKNQNDGVIMYVKSDMIHNVVEPQGQDASYLVCHLTRYKLSIITIYRSPSIHNQDTFLCELDSVLASCISSKNIVVVGDINIDITPKNLTQQAHEYLNLLASHGLIPSHKLPTRKNTCLDHAMIKSDEKISTLVIDTDITDHKPIVVNIEWGVLNPSPKLYRTIINYPAVVSEVMSVDFEDVMVTESANCAAESLISTVGSIIEKHSKIVQITSKCRTLKPWITNGLLRCIRNRNNLYRKTKTDPENYTLKVTYLRYRNFCNKLLKNLKRNYEKMELCNAQNNPKSTWKVIKNLTSTHKNVSQPLELLHIASDSKTSINSVNNFFANAGKRLAEAFKPLQSSPNATPLNASYAEPSRSFVLLPTDEDEVKSTILGLRMDAAVGWDGISARLLRACLPKLLPVITHICNSAISSGCFPKVFKKAVVHPIHKSGDKYSVNNYRPISILPIMSKILEKIINKRLMHYLEAQNILASNQYGFRRGKSTEDAVASLVDHVVANLDKGTKCLGVFIDLSKAFDTIFIPYLLSKMNTIGIRGIPYKMLEDYLSDRTQYVKIHNLISNSQKINFGVPQGSILGPTLFLIYINDLCKLSLTNCSIFTYADDTALLIKGNNWSEIFMNAENALRSVRCWFSDNLLTMNLAKTVYMPFSLKPNTSRLADTFLLKVHAANCSENSSATMCNCPLLRQTNTVRYLGVLIDMSLNWKSHLDSLTARARKLIFIFKKLRSVADYSVLKTVYYALCQSIFTYCISIWGGAPKTLFLPLERAQRAVLKVMTLKPFRYPTSQLYIDCAVLTVRQLFVLHTILRVHREKKYKVSNAKSRRSYNVCPTYKCNTATAQRHYHFIGSHLYNKINKICNIFPLPFHLCKGKVSLFLRSQDYNETESLIKIGTL